MSFGAAAPKQNQSGSGESKRKEDAPRDNSGARSLSSSGLGGLPAQSDLLCELRAALRVSGSNHRIIRRQTPLGPVVIGRHVVRRSQMPLQHFQFLTVFETDDIVTRHRLTDW